jgi:sorting nexin-8
VLLQSQRDLYVATRDLFIRHERLSGDQVDRLRKRIEQSSLKLESVKAAQKDNWQDEADKLTVSIQKDQATISTLLNRRIFIRAWYVVLMQPSLDMLQRILNIFYSMWHEIRVVLHNRENTLLSQAIQTFAAEEQTFASAIQANWASLEVDIDDMPLV